MCWMRVCQPLPNQQVHNNVRRGRQHALQHNPSSPTDGACNRHCPWALSRYLALYTIMDTVNRRYPAHVKIPCVLLALVYSKLCCWSITVSCQNIACHTAYCCSILCWRANNVNRENMVYSIILLTRLWFFLMLLTNLIL